tara:strand:- start:13421 stop:14176 length:756 start_codon:yes stop_codon:yes gene_type:complete
MRTNTHFKIIVPNYNNEKWIKYCLKSVIKQEYENYQCIIIDDMSTDSSVNIIENIIKNDDRFILVKNTEKKLALRNIYEAIVLSNPSQEDVVITLDGDDWLLGNNVLDYLNRQYLEKKCWMTYGSYVEFPSKHRGKFSRQVPSKVIDDNSFRESEWMSSHLRTFKYWLWKQIKYEDLLNKEGKFCDGAWDMRFMFPMLEMCGRKSLYIEKIMLSYNRTNPLNEDKVDHVKLMSSEREIRQKIKYDRISKQQ